MKIVINACFGGFSLSDAAEDLYAKKSGFKIYRYGQKKYKHSDGEDLYEKNHLNKMFSYTFKKDHGDSFAVFPDDDSHWYSRGVERDDPILVEVVEEIKGDANGMCADLEIIEIPDGVDWDIEEYDGSEHISENHRTWR